MTDLRSVAVVLTAVLSASCGPEAHAGSSSSGASEAATSTESSASTSSTNTEGASSTTESSTASSSSEGSDGSSSAGDSGVQSCEDWTPPFPPYDWSLQDCLTDACPSGEVCRYDPNEDCGAHPVCVNPDTLACNCEVWGPEAAGIACPCPGYEGPLNELNQAPLECDTAMSEGPVTYHADCFI